MSQPQRKTQQQMREERLEVVSELYRKGYSFRDIQKEVLARGIRDTYSLRTVKNDVDKLLKEWREDRVDNIDQLRTTQRARLEYIMAQAFDQWEKSKEDYTQKEIKQKGSLDSGGSEERINTTSVEQKKTEIVRFGNPAYLNEARGAIAEINKLYGVYAPEKKELSGGISFTEFLMSSDVVDDSESE